MWCQQTLPYCWCCKYLVKRQMLRITVYTVSVLLSNHYKSTQVLRLY